MTVHDLLTALQHLPRDAELLASEPAWAGAVAASTQYRRVGARNSARGVPEVDRLSCCTFVFVDEAAEDVTAVELPRCG
jgi:hypothetical protein